MKSAFLPLLLSLACIDTGKDGDDSGGSDTATGEVDLATKVNGTYIGPISGPATDAAYSLTLTKVDLTHVRVEGADFASFEIPLVAEGSGAQQTADWVDGTFAYSSNHIDLVYNPHGLSFSGDRD
jgi:hypothetical protein